MKTVEQFLESDEMMLVHKGSFFFLINSLSRLMIELGFKEPAEMAAETMVIFKRSNLPESILNDYTEYMIAVNIAKKKFEEELEDE